MKKIKIAGLLFFIAIQSFADTLSLEQCYQLAAKHYPLTKQRDLIKKSSDYSVSNAAKGYLPQLTLSGQATYQSAVTQLPINLPGVSVPSLSKDQYKIAAEIYQPITDLAMTKQQKELAAVNAVVQQQQIEVELYKIKDRVTQLFFGILLTKEQLQQNALYKKDLQLAIDKITAANENGVALKSDIDVLKAEVLQADQRDIQLLTNTKAYEDMLALFINQTIDDTTHFIKPELKVTSNSNNRPELLLFDSQKKIFAIQNKISNAKNIPHLGLFFQEGYGRPTLNFLDNSFNFYYIGGIRLNWSLTGLYTLKKEKLISKVGQELIDSQKELFLFNTSITLKQQDNEMLKYQQLLVNDNTIIALRANVKKAAEAKLENGIITSSDYIREANKESNAREDKALHEVQLLLAQYNYQNTNGN